MPLSQLITPRRNEEKRSEVGSVRHVESPLKVLFRTARRIN